MQKPPTSLEYIPWFLGEGESPDAVESAFLLEDPVAYFRAAYRTVGPVFRTRYRGETLVALTGPDANEFAFKNHDLWSFEKAMPGFREELGQMHVTQLDGRPHVQKRVLLKPAFTMDAVVRHLPTAVATVHEVISTWPKGSFNLFQEMMKLLLTINSRTMLKCELTSEWVDKLTRYEEELMFGINVSAARHEYFARPTYASLRQEVFDFLDALVKKRLDGHREDDNFQAILDANAEGTLDAQDLRYDAYLLLIAGIENVSRLIFKVIERLCVNPEWKAEVVEELAAYQPDSFLRGLSAFPKLRATIMEVERLHPISVILLQHTAKEFTFGEYAIPVEQRILHGHTLVHFLDEIYDHPFDFRPRRWLENDYSKKTHATYGQGAHTCLGINISRIYTPIVLAELFQHRDVLLHYVPDFKNQMSDGACQTRPQWFATVSPK